MSYSKEDFQEIEKASLVSELPEKIRTDADHWEPLNDVEIPEHKKDMVKSRDIRHRTFDDGLFWHKIPAFNTVGRAEFMDVKFQNKNSITKVAQLDELLEGLVDPEFMKDVHKGMAEAPMNIRLSPYILSLIDWDNPYEDPLRRQFIPVSSTRKEDHPFLTLDSLSEQDDSPVPGLVHRYFDKALFLPLDVCPVYCRFCFRRESVGPDNATHLTAAQLTDALAYIEANTRVWEVILTGGDPLILSPRRIADVTKALQRIPHVKVIRWHTRVPVVMPEHITPDLVAALKCPGKAAYVAVHANHADELTPMARAACAQLIDGGIMLVSQTVLLKGVNDDADTLTDLMRAFVETRIKPYYLHHPDLAPGTAHFRVPVSQGQRIVAEMRGKLSGLAQPTYVLDIPGAHGKVPAGPAYVTTLETGSYRVTDASGNDHRYDDCCSGPSAA